MLVLHRYAGKPKLDMIVAALPDGRQIRFQLLGTKGSKIRVGIQAPDDVMILRDELNDEASNER